MKWTLITRSFFGQLTFFLFNFCLNLIPLTFQLIIFQTQTFWASILAYCAFSEKMIPLEIIAMFVCFSATITITVTGTKNATTDEEGDVDVSQTNYTSQ